MRFVPRRETRKQARVDYREGSGGPTVHDAVLAWGGSEAIARRAGQIERDGARTTMGVPAHRISSAVSALDAVVTGMAGALYERDVGTLRRALARRLLYQERIYSSCDVSGVEADTTVVSGAVAVLCSLERGSVPWRVSLAAMSSVGFNKLLHLLPEPITRREFERARTDMLHMSMGVPPAVVKHTRRAVPVGVTTDAVEFVFEHVGTLSWGDATRDVDGVVHGRQPKLVRLVRRQAMWLQYQRRFCANTAADEHGKVTVAHPDRCGSVHLGRSAFFNVASAITDCDNKQLTALDSVHER